MRISRTAVIALVVLGALALFFRLLPEPPERKGARAPADAAAPDSPVFAVTGVRLFDGESFTGVTNVVIAAGRIQAVGRDATIPDGAEVIDGNGKTLIPGLIDSHVHVFGNALKQALRFGVTTELDMFTTPGRLGPARERRNDLGEQDVADLYSSGILATAPGGHGTEYGIEIPTIDSPEGAESFVDERLAEGSDYIKIVFDDGSAFGADLASIDRATLKALVVAAHARGALAVVHVSDLESARAALETGADGLAHAFADRPVDDDLVHLARDSNAFLIATLSVLESVAGTGGGKQLLADERIGRFLGNQARQALRSGFGTGRGESYIELAKDNVHRLHEAGVPVLAGTDAPNPGTAHGASMHRELELLVEAGLSNARSLAAATSVPARVFGLDDRGRIREGMIADLLLLDGNPSSDITATRAIDRIWKDGRLVERSAPATDPTTAPAAPDDALISDFDGGQTGSKFRLSAEFGFGWQVTTDSIRNGNSEAGYEAVSPGADGSPAALAVSGEVKSGFAWPWAGVMFFPGDLPMQPMDFSAKTELVFDTRGDGGSYTVMLFTGETAQGMPVWVNFNTDETWRRVTIPLEDFQGADPTLLRGMAFTAGPQTGAFRFELDNVAVR